ILPITTIVTKISDSKINQKLWKADSSQPLLITIPKGELTEETLGRRLDEIEEYYRNIQKK
ncbi:hypothetical protein, partial [Fusobacterium necrophorum]|uniref:hypothetical protein n=1 Tax=Fusobacterium necrophorum TaxID=859 RepID=UPI0005655AC0